MQPMFRYILALLFFLPFLAMAAPSPSPSPQDLDLGGLLDSLGGLGELLNPKTFEYLAIILRNAASLLSDENTKLLNDALKLVGEILTPELMNQLKDLIQDVAPLISAVANLISAILSSLLG
ncbi:hypothetical protein VTO42DRAFT_1710 [Malbranchea cinnamomea]